MKIAIVGPYPPPYGGISVHIQRLEMLLKRDNFDVRVYKNGSVKRWIFSAWGQWWKFDIVHFHDIQWFNRFLIGILSLLGVRTILTIHGDSLENQLNFLDRFSKFLLKFGLRQITHIIAVKADIHELLLSIGVQPEHVSLITAYLPPIIEEGDINKLPDDVKNFVASHEPIIVTNAFTIQVQNNHDLYGIGLAIDLCESLTKEYPRLGILCFLSTINNPANYDKLVAQVENKNIQDNYHFVIGQPLPPALLLSNVFIRPTYQDGYSVSLEEAIELGIPAVASDICPRTPGSLLFKTGDLTDLISKVRQVLDQPKTMTPSGFIKQKSLSYQQLLEIYKKYLIGRTTSL